LISALSDEFVFGSLYVRGDTSTYPKPIFTALGTLFFLLLFFAVPWIRSLLNTPAYQNLKYYALGLTLVLLFGSGLFLAHRQLAILPIAVIISRRFWISIVLAALIFFLFSKVMTVLKERKKGVSEPRSGLLLLLVMFALASQIQVFPLFDQMHFWWGAPISFLILTLVVQDRFGELRLWSRKITVVISALFVVVVTVLFPWVSQITGDNKRMPNSVISLVSERPVVARSQFELQDFFSRTLKKDERILNLCGNSDVFFKANFVKPAARAFVFWKPMMQVDNLRKSILESHPDAIVLCSLNQVASFQRESEIEQRKILETVYPKRALIASFDDPLGKEWKIYRAVP
jgi:glucan phosphoethanolaminetransferase (alkaline phosphatase superfamily)